MKKLLVALFAIGISSAGYSQLSVYGGYTLGKYFQPESAPENMATKFNLGWDISTNEDQCLLFFSPGSASYTIDKDFEWGNLPHGAVFGINYMGDSKLGFQLGFSFLNNKYTGKRTNNSSGAEEKLTLKTRSAALTINFVYQPNEFVQPFIGLDLGSNSFRYWYDNGTTQINNQRLGYKTKISGKMIPGGKGFNMRLNAGLAFRLFHINQFAFKLVPQFQWAFPKTEDISAADYGKFLFRHSNTSLSFLFTYQLN